MSSSRPSRARFARFIVSLLRGWAQNATDGSGEPVPLARFDVELFPPFGGQSIELGAPVVLGRAVVERNPPALDQPVQRWIEGPLLHQQHVFRSTLDGFGDGVTVRRSQPQRAQNQQIER